MPLVDEPLFRLALLARAIVPFLFMMASIYLVTHMLLARLISSPQSQVLAFFTIVTSPLTRPIRRLLPPETGEGRVRTVALVVYLILWIATDRLVRMLPPVSGR
jgi:uncharacterized protein YggT (Ycf19 family)